MVAAAVNVFVVLLSAAAVLAAPAAKPSGPLAGDRDVVDSGRAAPSRKKEGAAEQWPTFESDGDDDRRPADEKEKDVHEEQVYRAMESLINKIIDESEVADGERERGAAENAAREGAEKDDEEDEGERAAPRQVARRKTAEEHKQNKVGADVEPRELDDVETPEEEGTFGSEGGETDSDEDDELDEFRDYLEYRKMVQGIEDRVRSRMAIESSEEDEDNDDEKDTESFSRKKRSALDNEDAAGRRKKRSLTDSAGMILTADEAEYLRRVLTRLTDENEKADRLISYLKSEREEGGNDKYGGDDDIYEPIVLAGPRAVAPDDDRYSDAAALPGGSWARPAGNIKRYSRLFDK